MSQYPSRHWTLPICVAAITAVFVFVIPFLFPPTHPAYGQSYVVGFNNRVAIGLLAVISVAVALYGWRKGVSPVDAAPSRDRVPFRYFALAAILVGTWTTLLAVLLTSSHGHSTDDGYFLAQMQKVFLSHMRIYSQVEFVYGPLLFYPTLWTAHLGSATPSSLTVAYYLNFLVDQLLGLGMLYVIINRLPVRGGMRTTLFICMAIFCFHPWMGLNYAYVRFLAPAFFLVLLNGFDVPVAVAAWAFFSGLLCIYISPEVGISYTLGVLAYAAVRAIRGQWSFLATAAAVLAGVFVAVRLAPPAMLSGLSHYSGGFHHEVLLPSVYLLYVLAAIVWLAPRVVAERLRDKSPETAIVLALYVSSMTMIPAMLGAEESMHVMANGAGLLLLAGIYASERVRLRRVWVPCTVAAYLFFLVQTADIARYPLIQAGVCGVDQQASARVARISKRAGAELDKLRSLNCTPAVELSRWEPYLHDEPFTILWPSYNYNVDSLIVSPRYRPIYFVNEANVYTSQDEELLISQLRQVRWAFLGNNIGPSLIQPNEGNRMELPTHFKAQHLVAAGEIIAREVAQHWVRVAQVNQSLGLYKRAD